MSVTKLTELLPNTQAYIRSLPAGLSSYPQCKASVTLLRPFLDAFPNLGKQDSLPPDLMATADSVRRLEAATHLPEVHFVALMCLLRDTECDDDTSYLRTIRTKTDTIASSPMLQKFVTTVSPKLMMLGARMMWSTMHPGTSFSAVKAGKNTQTGALQFEPYLFNTLYLRGIAASLEAMIGHTKATNARVILVSSTKTDCIFDATWTTA